MPPVKARLDLIPGSFWLGLGFGVFGTWLFTTALGKKVAEVPYAYVERRLEQKIAEMKIKAEREKIEREKELERQRRELEELRKRVT